MKIILAAYAFGVVAFLWETRRGVIMGESIMLPTRILMALLWPLLVLGKL